MVNDADACRSRPLKEFSCVSSASSSRCSPSVPRWACLPPPPRQTVPLSRLRHRPRSAASKRTGRPGGRTRRIKAGVLRRPGTPSVGVRRRSAGAGAPGAAGGPTGEGTAAVPRPPRYLRSVTSGGTGLGCTEPAHRPPQRLFGRCERSEPSEPGGRAVPGERRAHASRRRAPGSPAVGHGVLLPLRAHQGGMQCRRGRGPTHASASTATNAVLLRSHP